MGVLVNSYTAALQELMMQLLVHWRVSAAGCALAGACGCMCTGLQVRLQLPAAVATG